MNTVLKYSLLLGLLAGLSACSSVNLPGQDSGNYATDAQGNRIILDPFNPQSILAQNRSVYFALNQYTIDPQYQGMLKQHGNYLAQHPNQFIRVEGNTDARGSVEYNLALGQRRAVAVANQLVQYGASPTQIETISFGELKPRALGHTESDYAQNRRADIHYFRTKPQD